jgi:DNA-binding transcriptional MocR family regulator
MLLQFGELLSRFDRNYMRPQTRKLVRLISDNLNDEIVGALQGGQWKSSRDLLDELDVAGKTLYRHLDELEEEELLEGKAAPRSPGKAGRRPRMYRIADPAVIHFRNAGTHLGWLMRNGSRPGLKRKPKLTGLSNSALRRRTRPSGSTTT